MVEGENSKWVGGEGEDTKRGREREKGAQGGQKGGEGR